MGCFRFGCIYQIHAPKVSALHLHGASSCTVVYLGGSYASGTLSAFVRVSRHKTLCMYHLSHCFLLVFVFCLINIFSSSSFKFIFKYFVPVRTDTSKRICAIFLIVIDNIIEKWLQTMSYLKYELEFSYSILQGEAVFKIFETADNNLMM